MAKRIDLTGQKFNRLTVIQYDHTDAHGRTFWRCRCDCGGEAVVARRDLITGGVKSCGCLQKEVNREKAQKMRDIRMAKNDLTGKVFGKLTVVARAPGARWLCRCECGNEVVLQNGLLTSGRVKACGCSPRGRKKLDLTGQRFGMLTVLRRNAAETSAMGQGVYDCLCDCGREKTVAGYNLRSGAVTSCGCQRGRPPKDRTVVKFARDHGCSVCADNKSCDMTSCKYEKELIK